MRKHPKFIEAEDRHVFNIVGYLSGCFIIEDPVITYYEIESGNFYGLKGDKVTKLKLKAMSPEIFKETVRRYKK